MSAALTPTDTRKLVGILARLGSDFDGERAAAGLLASRLLRERGLSWDDLIRPALPRPSYTPPPPPPGIGWRADLGLALRHLPRLTPWECSFVSSLSARRHPTPRQLTVLGQIAATLRAGGYA